MEILKKENIEIIINEESLFSDIKKSIDNYYDIFSRITGINGKLTKPEPGILLPNGLALSPQTTAGSILSYVRTTKFLRGIKKGIDFQLNEIKKSKVRILYVGAGPFAELILPLLNLYDHDKLEISIVEFHKKSVDALYTIIYYFKYEHYFKRILAQNPIEFKTEGNETFDLLIIDTMQKALSVEPQVANTDYFTKFLSSDGILIPNEIKISAVLADLQSELTFFNGKWFNFWFNIRRKNAISKRIFLDQIFVLDKNISNKYKNINLEENLIQLSKFKIPNKLDRLKNLILLTEINIFGDVILSEEDDTGLTKLFYDQNLKEVKEGNEISFSYQLGSNPRFLMDIS